MKKNSSDGANKVLPVRCYAYVLFRNLLHLQRTLQNKFQPLKCLLSWRNSSRKKPKIRLWRLPFWNCTWEPGRIYVTSFRPTRNWREADKTATNLASFNKVSKMFFFFFFLKPIIHFTNFTAIFFGVGARVSTFLNCSQMSGVNSGVLHSLKLQGECSSAEFPASFTSLARAYKWARKRDLASEYCSKWWQRCRILGFFEDEFRKENLEFTDWNFGEWLNLAWGFY